MIEIVSARGGIAEAETQTPDGHTGAFTSAVLSGGSSRGGFLLLLRCVVCVIHYFIRLLLPWATSPNIRWLLTAHRYTVLSVVCAPGGGCGGAKADHQMVHVDRIPLSPVKILEYTRNFCSH